MLPLTNYELGSFSHTAAAAMTLPHCRLLCPRFNATVFFFFILAPPTNPLPLPHPLLVLPAFGLAVAK